MKFSTNKYQYQQAKTNKIQTNFNNSIVSFSVNQQINAMNQEQKWQLSDFIILRQLGTGRFGYVYAAKQKRSDYVVALKKMQKKQLEQNNFIKQVRRQIVIQSSLRHDNILKLFGYFWDQGYIYLILQYAPGGELYSYLKNRTFSDLQISIIIRQVCQGIAYLHSKNIIHRDIKPENLLISLGNIKIADFGWSIHSSKRRQTLCGTLDYLAPEMVKGNTHDSTVDIWGIGILAYQLAVGRPPFQTQSYQQTYENILNNDVQFPKEVSYELRRFIKFLLNKQSKYRPQINQVLEDDFLTFSKGIQLIL